MTVDPTNERGAAEGLGEGLDRWHAAVAGVLAKARRRDVAELPADAWRDLEETTPEGVTVAPLYTRADELPEAPLPGEFPFVRGIDADARGWLVSARYGVGDSLELVNTALLEGLENGVSALWLSVSADRGAIVGVEDLGKALEGVYLDLLPVTLDAGTRTIEAAEAFFALVDARREAGDGIGNRADVVVELGAAPLTDGGITLDAAVGLAKLALDREETVRTFVADGTVFHDNGATDAEEIGFTVAVALAYVRAMVAAGIGTEDAFRQIGFRFSASDDQFQTIAKFRAARLVWARIAERSGVPEAGAAPQHAVTSSAMMTRRDPWVNMLRTTLAAFGAGVGGATSVTVQPFDSAIPGGNPGTRRSFSERIARNTQLLLLEESGLGHVTDPAGGSWYVESLTAALADVCWERFREVERLGGFEAARADGWIDRRIDASWERRRSEIAHRRSAVTGVNEFPNLGEAPLPAEARGESTVRRYAADFEALRDRSDEFLAETGARPAVTMLPLGPIAEHNVRTTFVSNLMASGGIEARNPGPVAVDAVADALGETPGIVVVCGTDKRYADEAGAAIRAARAAGASRVLLAGPAKLFADADEADRPDDFLGLGIDAIAVLSDLLAQLGVK